MILYWPRRHYGDFAAREGCIRNQGKSRPQWMRKLPKPSGVIGYSVDQVGCFMWAWSIRTHFKDKFYCFALHDGMADDLLGTEKLTSGSVLFVLPYGGWMSETVFMRETREKAEQAGVITVSVPMNIARGEPWPIEISMVISTRIEIARRAGKSAHPKNPLTA